MDTVIVMVPHLGGGWGYHRAYHYCTLTEPQCQYIRAMGASIEYKDGTFWIRSNDPKAIEEYMDRLTEDSP